MPKKNDKDWTNDINFKALMIKENNKNEAAHFFVNARRFRKKRTDIHK